MNAEMTKDFMTLKLRGTFLVYTSPKEEIKKEINDTLYGKQKQRGHFIPKSM